eukprot:CAMPEP_0185570524 /NCGR_PEP_ID=MMETSP0434-20130131/2810_1 /TAXON_ID=626734 ORGANISM="Favella taraikaensis, Strain Fe Narragansett Bay" /NCGR_SAMPLE_ID=MMETSP0434 /ASSEMBLY_ACC=CAM_ASM_000379 /LENGTH=43 /DNA_ID= /DNA_START= /DNA_END= /DNA_ORIENTATION=
MAASIEVDFPNARVAVQIQTGTAVERAFFFPSSFFLLAWFVEA